jgi:hypothetical protein
LGASIVNLGETLYPKGESQMKHNTMLTISSLLSILFLMFHIADDVLRGMASGKSSTLITAAVLAPLLYGTLVLAGRRSGYVVTLLISLFAAGMPVLHSMGHGVGVGSKIANTSGALFFVWTLIALGVTGVFSFILSVRGLWNPQWGDSR